MDRLSYPYCFPAMTKTQAYRINKKPLVERNRRLRINRSLDQLKDFMIAELGMNENSSSRLEKADILEMTVNHLRSILKHVPGSAEGTTTNIIKINEYSSRINFIKASDIKPTPPVVIPPTEATVSSEQQKSSIPTPPPLPPADFLEIKKAIFKKVDENPVYDPSECLDLSMHKKNEEEELAPVWRPW